MFLDVTTPLSIIFKLNVKLMMVFSLVYVSVSLVFASHHVTIYRFIFFFSSRRLHTICSLVTGVQTCALPFSRYGLQNEKSILPTAAKVELIDRLSATGLRCIEATSFVSPKWVPQLADAAEVMAAIDRRPGVRYPVLVPNLQGYDRARAAGAIDIAVFTAASEAFNRLNTNAGIDESQERFAPVVGRARADGVSVRGYV